MPSKSKDRLNVPEFGVEPMGISVSTVGAMVGTGVETDIGVGVGAIVGIGIGVGIRGTGVADGCGVAVGSGSTVDTGVAFTGATTIVGIGNTIEYLGRDSTHPVSARNNPTKIKNIFVPNNRMN
tara:strand:- start:2052 stop:2423 length:372 start_codon:yes stop_codon:yes gene_type:complete